MSVPNCLQEILQHIAESYDFTVYEIKFSNNGGGQGYIGDIGKVIIRSEKKNLCLVTKSCGSSNKLRNAMPIEKLFEREIHIYENVLPEFCIFVDEHKLQQFQFAPTFYKGYMDKEYNILILQDLNESGYALYDPKTLLDRNHVTLAIRRYAQLHAISFAYQEQNSSRYKYLAEKLDDLFVPCIKNAGFVEIFTEQMKKISGHLSAELSEEKKVFENFITRFGKFFSDLPKMVDEYSVVVHGDCWRNNVMFKYDPNDPSKPTDLRFIDFQYSRVGSPMLDVLNFFYSNASRDVMDNVDTYLELYYNTLSNHLKSLGSDPDKVYPRSIMTKHWKKLAQLGLVFRVASIRILCSDEKQHKSISEHLDLGGDLSSLFEYETNDNQFNELNRHSVIHFVKNKLI